MRAIYAFSGDPITYGHLDIVSRAARTYDEVVVAIGANPAKLGSYLFNQEERLALTRICIESRTNVEAVAFSGLLGEFAYRHDFDVIIRGVRNNSDLEGELVLFAVNESLHPTVDTVFFPTRRQLSHISSGVVKAIVAEGGDVSAYCPLPVKEALERRILGQFTVGVAGGIAAGKTTVAKKLVEQLSVHLPATYISLDEIGHYVLGTSDELIYRDTRKRVAECFGKQVLHDDGSVDRRVLGRIVFADSKALIQLNELMREPMLARMYEVTREVKDGIILIEGAILVEACWTNLVNNNLILVDAPEDTRLQRLLSRNRIDAEEGRAKIARQVTADRRRQIITDRIADDGWGRLWEVDTADGMPALQPLVSQLRALAQCREVIA